MDKLDNEGQHLANEVVALVPCGHQRFCSTRADRVRDDGHGCPICRTDISFVLNLY